MQRRLEQIEQAIVQRGICENVFVPHDPKVMTFTLLHAALGVADWYTPDGPLPAEQIATQATEQLVAGMLAPHGGNR